MIILLRLLLMEVLEVPLLLIINQLLLEAVFLFIMKMIVSPPQLQALRFKMGLEPKLLVILKLKMNKPIF